MSTNKLELLYGGWFQRTTLHLSEVYEFLKFGTSKLDLDKSKLTNYQKALEIEKVERIAGLLEYVEASFKSGMILKYYEDGLYSLSLKSSNPLLLEDTEKLKIFYKEFLEPGLKYIFSLGAPTPKVLANITTSHQIAILHTQKDPGAILEVVGEAEYQQIKQKDVEVIKTPHYLLISSDSFARSQEIGEMNIFFREFKDQLETYLNIHRLLWEEIASYKEQEKMTGIEVSKNLSRLNSLEKTIDLISNRINQMGSYVNTRKAISSKLGLEQDLEQLFNYKFETLTDTLSYIKEIWSMTKNYLGSGIRILTEINDKASKQSLQSIQFLTMISVGMGILNQLAIAKLPHITFATVANATLIVLLVWVCNKIIKHIATNKSYKISIPQTSLDIKSK